MIILTGASGGIGKEILQDLSELDDVIALYNNSQPKIDVSKKIILFQKLNLSSEDEINAFVEKIKPFSIILPLFMVQEFLLTV